ncbi:hypothetical protein DY000_02053661 [Brassica cretica]|uniref:Ubiquitin-like protease family profile domain-containing protein n=1 Tax=Brassica cretica TaxID=69181 RepID=A0ABQ7AEP6_BRACR|nr:hypothetical protein DY000_02053661 [Brassica cretica]
MWRKTASPKLSSRPETGENHEPGSDFSDDLKLSRLINVNNFVQKDLDEMFPEWDGGIEDPAADNIIKVMFNDPGWKWTMDCWQVTGTHKVVKMEVSPVKNEVSLVKTEVTTVKSESVVKEESSRPWKKARKRSSVSAEAPAAGSYGFGMTREQIERAFKDISDAMSDGFGMCLREIKLLGDRMRAVEKKMGITKKRDGLGSLLYSETVNGAKVGQNEAKEPSVTTEPSSSTKLCLVKPADDLPSDEPSILILDKQVLTASDLLLEEARRQTKKETAMVNLREKNERERKLAPTQQTPFKGNSTAKQIISNKKEESSRPRKKARKGSSVSAEAPAAGSDGFGMTKEQIERAFKDISDAMSDGFGTCLREIKLLGDRMGAVEKKSESVNGGKVGQKEAKEPSVTTEPSSSTELCLVKPADDLPSDEPSVLILDKQVPSASDLLLEEARRQTKKETAMVNLREKSERERKHAPTQQTPFKGNSTTKQIIPNKKVGRGYDPFSPYDKKKSKELTEWLEEDPSYKLPLEKKPRRCPSQFYQVLRTPLEWLTDHQMDDFINLPRQRYQDHPQYFRSERMCLLDHIFSRQWRASYPDFKSDKGDANEGLGLDEDDIYAPVNFKNQHWFAIWILIPKRHIVVWDSIIKHISPEKLDKIMEPFVTMVPYLLVECAVSDEQKVQYTLEPYTYERQTVGVPQCRAGDCGPFTLKYIECHALGMEFSKALCPRNGKTIRETMAVDIFQELHMCHEWENQDNDENLGTYE